MKRFNVFKSSIQICLICMAIALFPIYGFSQQNNGGGKPIATNVSLLSNDGAYSYYRIDLQSIPGFFERSYLLDLLFADSKVLIDKTDISANYLDVRVSRDEEKTVVVSQLDAYLVQSKEMGEKTSEADKKELVKKYNKYK